MSVPFDSFVVFAEMRTGSNFLEANLNAFAGITCHGEAFNPHFIGYPKTPHILGVDQAMRDADPNLLLRAIKEDTETLGGFRYFHDHDPRVLDKVLDDRRCAKIILTRNPVESYISWKIAQETGQWKLTDVKARKAVKARFDSDEFEAHLDALQAFQLLLMNRLQTSGQTAFYVAYEDLQDVEVMNGLARYLGVDQTLEALDKTLKKQNPSPISDKVSNFDVMTKALAKLDRFDLTRTPNFEPRRGPNVPSYVAAAKSPVLYLPISNSPDHQVLDWMAALDGVGRGQLIGKMSQKDLRQWKRRQGNHRSFTVLHHPVERAHDAFCRRILTTGKGGYAGLRETLMRRYKLPLPDDPADPGYDVAAHRAAFVAFIGFLKGNLAGQTAIRVDQEWCTQAQTIQGFAEFALPDRLIRHTDLQGELTELTRLLGIDTMPEIGTVDRPGPYALEQIYDEEIEDLLSKVYQRDYMMFGFDGWR